MESVAMMAADEVRVVELDGVEGDREREL